MTAIADFTKRIDASEFVEPGDDRFQFESTDKSARHSLPGGNRRPLPHAKDVARSYRGAQRCTTP